MGFITSNQPWFLSFPTKHIHFYNNGSSSVVCVSGIIQSVGGIARGGQRLRYGSEGERPLTHLLHDWLLCPHLVMPLQSVSHQQQWLHSKGTQDVCRRTSKLRSFKSCMHIGNIPPNTRRWIPRIQYGSISWIPRWLLRKSIMQNGSLVWSSRIFLTKLSFLTDWTWLTELLMARKVASLSAEFAG